MGTNDDKLMALIRGTDPEGAFRKSEAPALVTPDTAGDTAALNLVTQGLPQGDTVTVGALTMHVAQHRDPSPATPRTGLAPATVASHAVQASPEASPTRLNGRLVRPDHNLKFTPEAS